MSRIFIRVSFDRFKLFTYFLLRLFLLLYKILIFLLIFLGFCIKGSSVYPMKQHSSLLISFPNLRESEHCFEDNDQIQIHRILWVFPKQSKPRFLLHLRRWMKWLLIQIALIEQLQIQGKK